MRWVIAIALLVGTGIAHADDTDPNVLPAKQTATLGFHIISVRDVDLRAGTFFAQFYYWMLHDKVGIAEKDKLVETLEFMNGSVTSGEPIESKDIGNRHYICWRAEGTFHFTPELHYYPFDHQQLEIVVENPDLEREYLTYADDAASYQRAAAEHAGLKDDLVIDRYTIDRVERGESLSTYKTDFGDPKSEKAKSDYSRFTVRIVVTRTFLPYFFKILLPLLVILGVAYLVFWLPAKELGVSSTLAITALLSCIAFQISVASSLPEVGYLITSDKLFMATYMMIFLALIGSLWTFARADDALRWQRRARIAYPLMYVLMVGFLMLDALI